MAHSAKVAAAALAVAALVALTAGGSGAGPHCSLPGPPAAAVDRLPTSQRVVALTFDAGAGRGYAPRILDTLRRTRTSASFGVTGRWAQANPDLIKRIVESGSTLINHTYDHRSFTGQSTGQAALLRAARQWEVTAADSVVRSITGRSTRPYFRPPYGDGDVCTAREVRAVGYRYDVLWTVDSRGWAGLPRAKIERRVLTRLRPGEIYLFHVGAPSQDAAALPNIIQQIRARGYRFATVSQYWR